MNLITASQILSDKHSAIDDRLEAHSYKLRRQGGNSAAEIAMLEALADIALKLSGKKKVEDWI